MNQFYLALLLTLLFFACSNDVLIGRKYVSTAKPTCDSIVWNYVGQAGCDGQQYPDPAISKYTLPFKRGELFLTGLSNCSSSYHGAGQPDQYAFDFDMPMGTDFIAAREGVVAFVEEGKQSGGGDGAGNFVLIDHQDGTFAYYLHSPMNGIFVNVGDQVKRGQVLGITGESGLAGYPHLHFIVVLAPATFPYRGIPITFRNAIPGDIILQSYKLYKACELN
jgi:murein DD-endopeptidase MepM/ murein hydrolase activator NlpD